MTQNPSTNGRSNVSSKITSVKAVSDGHSIISIIDKSLKHLNQISEANTIAQDLYIELLKEKKTMKFDHIKKIYMTLTEGKAKEILFERDKKQLVETDYQNHEGLVRLCWRSIEKLIKKITYYMINENHLSVISKNVLKLIQLNQKFVRRFQKRKNSSMLLIVEIMQKLIEENSILQNKIYDILLNRGYVVSLDEFYNLNGHDAEHLESYSAKKEQESITTSSSEDEEPDKQEQKPSAKNSRNQTIRKKKGFRFDPRYSWREKIQIQQIKQSQKYPANKTNFQIRQSFEKFIGDFLENQNLNEILTNFQFQTHEKQLNIQKPNIRLSEASLMSKKIFQNKIGSVINQLKGNNVKAGSKLLQIINLSSDQTISSKVGFAEKRFIERKNSDVRDSGITHRKLIETHLINDRKIVNQSFFRQFMKKNAKIQNFVNQQILKDTKKMQQQLDNMAYRTPEPNPKVIIFNKKRHNQNNAYNPKVSNFTRQKTNQMLVFNPRIKTKDNNQSLKSIKSMFRFMETQLSCKYSAGSKKIFPEFRAGETVSGMIKVTKQEWQLRNERKILETIKNSTLNDSNVLKLTQILQGLENNKDLKIDTLPQIINDLQQKERMRRFMSKKEVRFEAVKTELGQKFRNNNALTKEAKQRREKNVGSTLDSLKRTKTEQSPRNDETQRSKEKYLESWKENNKHYQIYDRRLRRILRR